MNEAAKKARREYQRQWNKKNPEKLKQYREKYWSKKAAQAAEEQEQTENDAQED